LFLCPGLAKQQLEAHEVVTSTEREDSSQQREHSESNNSPSKIGEGKYTDREKKADVSDEDAANADTPMPQAKSLPGAMKALFSLCNDFLDSDCNTSCSCAHNLASQAT